MKNAGRGGRLPVFANHVRINYRLGEDPGFQLSKQVVFLPYLVII